MYNLFLVMDIGNYKLKMKNMQYLYNYKTKFI